MTTTSFEQVSMTLDSGDIPFLTAGSGHDVVCLHSAAGIRMTAPLRRLASRFRVWVPTMPGFDGTGYHDNVSSITDLADLVADFIQAGPQRACDIVGSSLGGWIAAWIAVRHPALVEHMVLSAPAGFRPAGAPPLNFEPEIMRTQLYAYPERVERDDKSPEIREANGRAVAHYGLGHSHDSHLHARLGEISCQTLILHGTLDVRVPSSGVQMLKSCVPHSRLVYVYDAAHSLEADQPERVGSLIEDFLLRGEAFIINQKQQTATPRD